MFELFHRDPSSSQASAILLRNKKAMVIASKGHLLESELSDDAQRAAQGCRDFLLQAQYRPQGQYEICDDKGLEEQSRAFYTEFAPLVKTQSNGEIRLTALRFTKRSTLPVADGATVYLIPIIISKSPMVSDKIVRLGWSLHLTKPEIVEPEFYCLAVLTR